MAARTVLSRLNDWSSQHPWRMIVMLAALGIPPVWLIPPRENPISVVVKFGFYVAIMIGVNWLRFRTAFPSQQQIEAEERKADEIVASVRSWRERGGGL